jgi:hypothetical protein
VARTPAEHSEDSSYAATVMWSGVADRNARLRNAHDNSPSGLIWHARRLFGANVELNALTEEQLAQAEAARLMWYRAVSKKGVKARRLQRAQQLRARADAIEAEVGE